MNTMGKRLLAILLLLAMSFASVVTRANNALDLGIGYEKTSGDYGQVSDTDITTVSLVVDYKNNAWRYRLGIPYISVTGDGSVIPGTNTVASNITHHSQTGPISGSVMNQNTGLMGTNTQSGIGDITSSVSYAIFPTGVNSVFYEVTAEIKWGTASEQKNLGTGENDYSLRLYATSSRFKLKPFISLGYIVAGDTSIVQYNDVIFVIPGLMYDINPDTSLSVAYEYDQAFTDGADEGRMISLQLGRKVDHEWSADAYMLYGLSNAVADIGLGLNLVHRY